MKTTYNLFFKAFILMLAIAFSACQGDQGDPGPTGAQGGKGDKGDTGATGATGAGLDELLAYGNINMTITGQRPDGEDFTEVQDFKYIIEEGGPESSAFYDYGEGYYEFRIYRSYKGEIFESNNGRTEDAPGNMMQLQFYIEDGTFYPYYLNFYSYVTTDDNKFFQVYTSSYVYENENFNVISHSFNPETGDLEFIFEYEYYDNYDHLIKLHGEANVKVKESIDWND